MKLSKILYLAVVLALVLGVASCTSGAAVECPDPCPPCPPCPDCVCAEAAAAPAEPEEPEEPEMAEYTYEDMVVGFLQTGSEGGWRAANTASFKETAEQLGITLKFYDSQNDLARQVAGFHQFNQDPEVNVIILAALETTGWDDVLKDAQAAGKVVVIEDRRIDASEDLYATYIGSDFAEEGRKSADEMCKLLEGMDGKNVWELVGNVGSSAAKDRGQGFRERMGECGIDVTKSQTANWSITEGKEVTEAWLKETQDVQGIFAQNDEMGLGAIEALKEAGLTPGVDVKILSVDATAGAFKAMLDGDLNVTVECNPLLAPQVYEAALKALNGESLPKWVPSQEGVFSVDMPNLQEIADGRKY
jgi:ABC-type sugar transport system substrate-binding protein